MERLRAGVVVAAWALLLSGLLAPAAAAGGTVTFTTLPPQAVVGGPSYAPSASDGSQTATVAVDAAATTNGACTLDAGAVSFPHAGTCVLEATISGDSEAQAQQAFAVAPAGTATALSVSPSGLAAAVSATPPGGGMPAGTVAFTVGGRLLGGAELVNGVATLSYSVPPNVTEEIVATYQGDADYQGSAASQIASGPDVQQPFLARPRITAHLTSRRPRSRHGWWRASVRVRFSCSAPGSVIAGGCPRPVLLARSGRDLSLTRTIRTTSGARASVTVRSIRIDLTRPRVAIRGIRAHALYRHTPPRGLCVASDRISGIASCTITRSVRRHGTMERITFTATATSGAGARRSVSRTVRVRA